MHRYAENFHSLELDLIARTDIPVFIITRTRDKRCTVRIIIYILLL